MKSEFPYLVDIGLGSFCPLAGASCHVPCYASSHKDGLVADIDFINHSLYTLFHANVFEVVFGSMEPTLYKFQCYNLLSIVSKAKEYHFKVGITTRNYHFYKQKIFENCLKKIDSIAISCNSEDDLEMATHLKEKIHQNLNPYYISIYVQNILGLYPYDQLVKFVKKTKELGFHNLTLLGYKDFGFGAMQKPYEIPDQWIEMVKNSGLKIGIDSILSQKYKEKLISVGVNNYCLVGEEGKQTCYLDCLTRTVSPSSFSNQKFVLSKRFSKEEFLEVYSKF